MDTAVLHSLDLGGDLEELACGFFRVGTRLGSMRSLNCPQRATREGHCFQHVQTITAAIDQYAEKR
jgi:hypothetical protein